MEVGEEVNQVGQECPGRALATGVQRRLDPMRLPHLVVKGVGLGEGVGGGILTTWRR